MPKLLDENARTKVAATIAAAEARCQGEIVFGEASRSDDYGRWFAMPVFVLTVALAWAVHLAWPAISTSWLLVLQPPVAMALWWLFSQPRLALILVPNEVEIEAVRAKALQLFAHNALYETPHRAGVLIFVSAFERRVEILADKGLDGVIDENTWQQHVAHIVQAIHAGHAAEGVCEVVDRIANRLAAEWGAPSTGRNDLPNMI